MLLKHFLYIFSFSPFLRLDVRSSFNCRYFIKRRHYGTDRVQLDIEVRLFLSVRFMTGSLTDVNPVSSVTSLSGKSLSDRVPRSCYR